MSLNTSCHHGSCGPISHREWLHAKSTTSRPRALLPSQYLKEEICARECCVTSSGIVNEKRRGPSSSTSIHHPRDRHETCTGVLRSPPQSCHDFCGKDEQQRAVSFPAQMTCVQDGTSRAGFASFRSPRSNDRPQSLNSSPRPLFVSVDGTSGGVARVVLVPVIGRFDWLIFTSAFGQGFIQSLFFLDEFPTSSHRCGDQTGTLDISRVKSRW